jgi:glycoside/pentoside/hexuronide:cation symporter, GPH family
MTHRAHTLSFKEKAGYALGDAATNFFFQAMIMYQGKFYTDVMGLSSSAAAWLFLIVRGWDAIFDPVVGTLADRTRTRWGKFRPWVLWTAVPYGVILWLAYTVPAFEGTSRLIYAYATYTLLMMIYSANNTPYSALNGVMTGDNNERTSLAQFRFVAAMVAQLIVQGFTLPLVDKFGAGNAAKGWSTTFGIYGFLVAVFCIIAFLCSRERVQPDPQQRSSIRQDIADVFRCPPWVVMFLITILVFTTLALRGTSIYYYFTYYLDKTALLEFVKQFGLGNVAAADASAWKTVLGWFGFILTPDGSNATSVGLSLFNIAGTLVLILGVMSSKPLAARFGKKAVFGWGLFLTTIITMVIVLVPPDAIGALFILFLLWPAAYGPTIPLLWAMIADVADYSEWKTGRRATGFVYAGVVFALKLGLGVGGALANGIIGYYGYVPNVAQTERCLEGIRWSATIYSGIPFGLGVVCLLVYPITKNLNLQISTQLAERRSRYAPA